MRRPARLPLVVAGAAAAAFVLTASPAHAELSPTPSGPTGWTPDGAVLATVATGSTVYVGGDFTGGVAALDATTGALKWTGSTNGPVRALDLTDDGSRLILGGKFTTVGGATHRQLAALDAASGAVVPSWRGAAGGVVRDVLVVGETTYFAGTFLKHGGMAQRGLGAVTTSSGALVTSFTPSADSGVFGLASDGSRLFFSGKFTAVNGIPRNQVASVDLATGSLDPWLTSRPCTGCNVYWDVAVDDDRVYVVGRNAWAIQALDKVTGLRRWQQRVYANGDAQAVTFGADGLLYVGGHFVTVMGQPRSLLAALDPATGNLQGFSARFVTSYPGIWALAASPSRLYVGGYFTAAGPAPNRFPYFAMFPWVTS
ncbi:PQQ-binding-like beta-propeller repeat protein [Nocardioides caldifontis]|uniref:outer membrane protein assembly factor BamB family protein n=1 Tax=Nocardioides caldifontis TaxID=2588938 RepID=UPI0011DF4C2D|nr:PQQ-binding-like beta-propeller repeat protein [Nocardioides caldifontis]